MLLSLIFCASTEVQLGDHLFVEETFAILAIVLVIVRVLRDDFIKVIMLATFAQELALVSEAHEHIVIVAIRVKLEFGALS